MDFIKNIWSRPIYASVIVFTVIFGSLVILYSFAEGDPIVDDHYFHFKYAYLLRTEGLDAVKNFDWIYLTPYDASGKSRYNVSLFQVSLIPFTYMRDWLFALHIADAFYASVVVAIFYFIMRRERVKHPLFFSLLLVGMISIFGRLLLGRALVLMIGLIFLEMYFAIHKKYLPLLITAIIHVMWHQATFFLPLIIVIIVEFSRFLINKSIAWKNGLWSLIAIVIGMSIFPGFPRSLISWVTQIFTVTQNGRSVSVGKSLAGNELTLIDFSMYSAGQGFAMVILFCCLMAVGMIFYLYKKQDHAVYTGIKKGHMLWLVSLSVFIFCIIGGSFMITGRLYDFLLPTFVLLLAFTVTALKETELIPPRSFTSRGIATIAWSIVLLLCVNSFNYFYLVSQNFDYTPTEKAAQWIDERSEDDEHVFLLNWSFFTIFFFENSNNTYSTGIEPLALRSYDEDLYWKYYNIFFNGFYCEDHQDCRQKMYDELMVNRTTVEERNAYKKENSEKIINTVRNDFDARFIVSESKKLRNIILLSPELVEEYQDFHSDHLRGNAMQYTVFKLK